MTKNPNRKQFHLNNPAPPCQSNSRTLSLKIQKTFDNTRFSFLSSLSRAEQLALITKIPPPEIGKGNSFKPSDVVGLDLQT